MNNRILLYTDDPEYGGVAQYNHALLLGLAARGHHVTVAQSYSNSPLIVQQQQHSIQHQWITFDTSKDFERTITDVTQAQTIFTHSQPDLIIFSDCCPISNLAAKEAAIALGIPYIIIVGFVASYLAENFANYLNAVSQHYRTAKAVVAVSAENLAILQGQFGLPKERGQVIHYGRPKEYFEPRDLAVRDRLRQEIGIPSDGIVCLTTARLEPVKGFEYQLAAIAQLQQNSIWQSLYFVWAGDGSLKEELLATIAAWNLDDRVKLIGQRWDIAAWLDAADIFVLPSQLEGMPLSIMEAMAKGVPVIASAVSGIPEELEDTGQLLADPKLDPEATINELANTIKIWVENPDVRVSIGQAGKHRAEVMFSEEKMIQKTVDTIDRALETNASTNDMSKINSSVLEQLLTCVEQARAIDDQHIATNLNKHQLRELHQKGRNLYTKNDLEAAIEVFTTITKLNPGSAVAHRYLSVIYWQQGELCKSVQHQLLQQSAHQVIARDGLEEFHRIWQAIRPYTLLEGEQLLSLYSLAKQICLDDIPGNFVECGSYKGGSAALLAYIIKHYSLRPRQLYAFDTFQGMPEPIEIDQLKGIPANDTPWGGGTLAAPLSENLELICQTLGVKDIVIPIPGLFAETLPVHQAKIGEVAFLYADADWYESTLEIFNNLYSSVVPNGIIQVDDYLTWEGCTAALNEFERQQQISFDLRVIDEHAVWFYKEEALYQDRNDWRTLWCTAQMAEKLGDTTLAQRTAQATLKIVPDLLRAEEMLERIQLATAPKVKLGNCPLVSVVIPCYNQARFLPEAVSSVIAQTYENWEILIVNDGSPDNTNDVARDLIAAYPDKVIKLVEKINGGPASARNAGIATALGEYILPLDADDKLTSTAIAKLLELCLTQDTPCVAFGSYKMFGLDQRTIISADLYSLDHLKQFNMLHACSMYHQSIWQLVNGYKLGVDSYEDWEFWLNCHQHDVPFIGTRDIVVHYRKLPGSMLDSTREIHDQLFAKMVFHHPALFDVEVLEKARDLLWVSETLNSVKIQSINELEQLVTQYRQTPNDAALIERLKRIRWEIAHQWLQVPTEQLKSQYQGILGQVHQLIYGSEFNGGSELKYQPLTVAEQEFVADITAQLNLGLEHDRYMPYLLAAMLYCQAHELTLNHDLDRLPDWLISDYVMFMTEAKFLFQQVGEVDRYYHHMKQWVDYLHEQILRQPDSQFWQSIAIQFRHIASFTPLCFTYQNLKEIYVKRADIIAVALTAEGCELDYEFSERSPKRNKVRLGILAAGYSPLTETFSTLPAYKHLNRDEFEIILFSTVATQHRLERYCIGHADAFVVLPKDLKEQVQMIRDADLDIILIATNTTQYSNQTALLATHRLARIQIANNSSCVTTGMRNVDYFISGTLTEPDNAQQQYSETLLLLDGPAHCYDFATEANVRLTQAVSRGALGISPDDVVYISGANFFKINPDVERTWVKILTNVPNSKLILYPFNPNWFLSYPLITTFHNRLRTTLAEYGVDKDRLLILEPVPNYSDVKERLKLADVYLDSYPFSGATSLLDPLTVGLPLAVMDGNSFRSRMGAAFLRELHLSELVATNEDEYIKQAIALGKNSHLRQQQCAQIQQAMQHNPRFIDSRNHSAQMETIFLNLFHQHQAAELSQGFRLRHRNLIAFPDWHQSEDNLFCELADLLRNTVTHSDRHEMTLLIYAGCVDEAEADMAISSVLMHLFAEEAIEVDETGPEIVLVGELTQQQWHLLRTQLTAKISLAAEDKAILTEAADLSTLPAYQISSERLQVVN